ncbi:macrolide export ATP-binding/permease protein MacB [Terrihabitans soli]|uniref:Pyoverdine export ATP-binding/permease protein PvdT n=1 Tax=Terrihabitans soli TaxID=708113 RepID=A0A6S6QNI8_9HYPH|nr:MacB family efflux pump subunit [Terrihabitans soli]BCJ92084.1 macrolide export ATP-binding/permease protein MacB [Terrihabitans soli]
MNRHVAPPEVTTAEPLIALDGIRKTYGGEVPVEVLRGITLRIYPGEFVAIMGASGSGKSTLMNLLGCLDRPSSGTYHFAGKDVSHFDRDELARLRRDEFGFVFQSYNLIPAATAVENVEVPAIYAGVDAPERHRRAAELLTSLGLAERLNHRPNQLSGGQQQRVSIARALMNGGRIILADEPTGALDSKSGAEVMALLKDLAARGHTIILITHDREVARHARRVIEIRDGQITADSGPDLGAGEAPSLPAAAHVRPSPLADAGEAVKMALRALRTNMFRTVLTLLGIMIGVASVVAMLAVGEGAQDEVMKRIGSMGSNLLVVRPGAPNERYSAGSGVRTLMPEDADALASLPNVTAAMPERQGNVTIRIGNRDYATQATATSVDLPQVRSWPVEEGVFFTPEDVTSHATVAVIGKTVEKNLFGEDDALGAHVLVNNVPFQVIGVMSGKGATGFGTDQDDVIFVPITTGGSRLFGETFVRSITVAASDVSKIGDTETEVRRELTARHGKEDFQIRNMASIVETMSATQQTLAILLASIASISLLVGGIGIMNIMLMSVTERTREIGIRMATGASTRNVLQQFLTEAVVVAAFGGTLGMVLGFAAGFIIQWAGLPLKFTALPAMMAFGCAVLTGVVFGFMPALKAAKLDPVAALASD